MTLVDIYLLVLKTYEHTKTTMLHPYDKILFGNKKI